MRRGDINRYLIFPYRSTVLYGGISSSLVTKTCSVLDTSDETVRAKSSDSSEDGSSPGSVWPPGLSYMTTDVARDT